MKRSFKNVIIYIVFIAVVIIVTSAIWNRSTAERVLYSDVVSYFQDGRVKSFEIDSDNNVTLLLRSNGA